MSHLLSDTTRQIQEIYIGLLGRAADLDGLTYWNAQISSHFLSLEQLRANIVNLQPEYINGLGSQNRIEVVTELYSRLFEREPDTEGFNYWVNGAGKNINADQLVLALVNGANASDRLILDNKLEAAEYYTSNIAIYSAETALAAVDSVDSTTASVAASKAATDNLGTAGSQISLTDRSDNLTGSTENDIFNAPINQNSDNTLSNTLANGDKIDAGAGLDRLSASIINENNSTLNHTIVAQTQNLEVAEFDVRDESVIINALHMDSVEEYWSDYSEADLNLINVNLGSHLKSIKDITFGLRDTAADTNFLAAFETSDLATQPIDAENSNLLLRVSDLTPDNPLYPLANVEIQLSFTLNGQSYSLTNIQSTDGTYAGLVTALNNALPLIGLASAEASLGSAYNQTSSGSITLPFTANEIVLSASNDNEFEDVSFQYNAIDDGQNSLITGEAQTSNNTNLIETNLILDNAGLNFAAGDILIGDTSFNGQLIEKLNLAIDRNSEIGVLATSSNMLSSTGELTQGLQTAFEHIEVTSLSNQGSLVAEDILNARTFDASKFEGESLSVRGDAISGKAYSYNTGGSKDTLTVDINLQNSQLNDFTIVSNTQGNDDNVRYNFQLNAETSAHLLNSILPSNVGIITGDGDDAVTLNNVNGNHYIVADVDLGTGNDTFVISDSESSNTTMSIVEITAGAGDDFIVLNPSTVDGSGYSKIRLTNDFGNDTLSYFNTGNASGTSDVIDYSAFLDSEANERSLSPSSVTSNEIRTEQGVAYSFQNLADTNSTASLAAIDHNKVITVKLSDILSELNTLEHQPPTGFGGIDAEFVQQGLNGIFQDNNFTSNGLSEAKQAGSQVVFNVVYDQQFQYTNGQLILGDATNLTTQSVFTASVAYNSEAEDNDSHLSLINTTKQGTLSFINMDASISSLTTASIAGTTQQQLAAQQYTSAIEGPSELILTGASEMQADPITTFIV